jgi:hypothetical protein
MVSKNHILAEIKRTTEENGGKPLGRRRFFGETGIKENDWLGKYWARWGDALIEAGFPPNRLQAAYDEHFMLEKLAGLVRELGHFPAQAEIQLKSQSDPSLPNNNTFQRLGNKSALIARLLKYCETRNGYEDVIKACGPQSAQNARITEEKHDQHFGHVYLLKSGRYYKIGMSNAVGRREYELSIQLPEKASVVHRIKTDDPSGIEDYWHRRFATRRKNGEWFELTPQDLSAFKRRKTM